MGTAHDFVDEHELGPLQPEELGEEPAESFGYLGSLRIISGKAEGPLKNLFSTHVTFILVWMDRCIIVGPSHTQSKIL